MRLVVFGANGPTGRQVVRQALIAGHQVTAVTRRPDQYPINSPALDVMSADVVDTDAVERVLGGHQAVVSTFGVPYSKDEITVYSRGIANIVRGMTIHGIKRLVCVSSNAVTSEEAPGEWYFYRKVYDPFLRNMGRTLYDDMQRMEEIVRSSNLDWTIVRPAGLFDASEPTDNYQVSTRRLAGRFTSRADLAQTLLKEAVAPQHVGSTIEVITTKGAPMFVAMFLKEALGVGK